MTSTRSNAKRPNKIDVIIGQNIRLARRSEHLSQEELGLHLGISFQQIQKYEKGKNRVGAARLCEIGAFLGKPMSFFFEGCSILESEQVNTGHTDVSIQKNDLTAESIDLLKSFLKIESEKIRKQISQLVRLLASYGQL